MKDELSKRAGEISAEKLALLVLRAKKKRAEAPAAGRIPRRPVSGPAPLSFAQQRLWVLDRLEPGSTAYNMPSHARLQGPLDVAALERALGEIVRRHESLRTTFSEIDGEPVQVVSPPGDFRLPFTDLTGLADEPRRLVAAEKRPYDLERGPLFRAHLVRTDEEEHLLLLDMHHVISDGWSYGVFFRELGALYGAFVEGRPSPLPELPIQLSDFAAWQREWLQGPVQQEQLAYWRERLAGAPPALELPLDRVRPAVQTHHGEVARLDLQAGLAAGLRELARREGASPFMTLLAVFQLLLSRLSGQDDVVVGSPSAGRSRMEMEGLIGLFLNTLVLRTDLAGDPTFRELLGRVKDVVLGAYQYQDIPFERLLEELQPERQLSRTPIFQVLFNFVSLSDLHLELAGLRVEPVPLEGADSKFDFTLYVHELPETVRLDLVYNPDLFEPGRMEEMLRQLEHLLAQIVAAPEMRIGALSLVTPAAAALLPDPAQPLSDAWRGAVHHAVSIHPPERLAVSDAQGTAWTYGELEARANRLARFLIAHGVEKGDVVAVWAQRNAPLVQALMGTLKAGAAFLILDPAYPAPRLLEYLRIARPTAWIGVPGAPGTPVEVEEMAASLCRCRIDLAEALDGLPETDPLVPVGPDDTACITFTSGSTGIPKGVVGRHGPLSHFYPFVGERFELGADDRFGMLSALSHDPLQRDVFTPLWFGARIVVPDADEMATPGYLAAWVHREKITVLNLTPAMMEVLVDSAKNGLPDLRRAFVVGDLLKKTDVERLQRLAPNVICVNLYGSTETQRSISYFVVPRGGDLDRLGKEVLPLGRGMEGCQLLVRNRAGLLAGVGEVGEIVFRGPHLAKGYLGDEALTAERFGPDTYRTGDLGRYLPDGGVEIVGRADSQVKLRGFRIELGEVEAALERFPGVKECTVIVRDRALVAYLVAKAEPSTRELRAFLGERLPDYMVPSAFVVLPALPLTRTGKIDRRALPDPGRVEERESAAPRNAVEEALAQVWAEVLRRERVGIHDNFFELGGDSIRTIQVVARSRKLGVKVAARQIFQYQTIAELAEVAELVEMESHATVALVPPGIAPEDENAEDVYPLSPGQQGMLMVLVLSGEGSEVYFDQSVVTLAGDLDTVLWRKAWQRVVDRHPSLRTYFVWESREQPLQVVRRQAELPWTELDWRGLPEPERASRLADFLREDRSRGFDLGNPPLLRLALIRLDDESWKMIWSFHHLIVDGWSLSRVFGEVVACYTAFREGREPGLEAPRRFRDYIAWLQRQDLGRAESFWRSALAGFDEPTPLPYDGTGSGTESMTYGREMAWIPQEETEALTALARRHQLTLNTLFQGAWGALLGRATGREDVIFGSVVSGRPGEVDGIESVVGFFINVLPVRVAVGAQTVLPALAELQARQIEQRDFEYCPLESIQAWSELPRGSRLIESLLVFQNFPLNPLELTAPAGFRILDAQVMGATHYPITLYVAPRNDGLDLRFDYHVSRLGAEPARRLLGHLRTILSAFAARPDARMSELPLLTRPERQVVLALAEGPPGGGETCIHELVRQQAERTPDAPALEAGGTVLTYRELMRRAGLLARRLRRLGVGPESVVGLCVERSPEMVIGMLGVLEAGGVYLPLDPVYPRERLSFMQEDSGARVLLTQESFADLDDEDAGGIPPVPTNGAYIIYTSGSTGKPKGVLVPHSSLVNYVRSTAEEGEIIPGDRVLQFASMSFDTSAEEIYPCLTQGATLVLRDDAMAGSPELFLREVERLGITVLDLPTAFWHELMAQDLDWPASLRLVILGGEQAHAARLDAWRERVGDRIRLLNTYGPTEATIVTTRRDLAGPRDFPGEVPIGRPVAGARIHVVSRDLEPLPPGLDGELVIGGAGVARGYLGRPDLTAERFVPDPFAQVPGSRLYRTGDLARWLPAGELEFRGRLDHQVKVRGFRIELGEIEAALRRLEGVRDAAVLVREDAPGDRRIVAYVVGISLGVKELRDGLKETLPDYMLPAAFVTLDALPLTPSGKVDRRALPAPGTARPDLDFAAPRNPVEEMLAGIFCEVLKLDRVGIDDDFFVLGGHSLLVAQVATRARQALGVELPIPEIFRRSTVARLAELVEKGGAEGLPGLPPVVRVPRDGRPIPLSFPQERVWFLNQLTPGGNIAYNFQFTLTFHGPLDLAVLEAAFTEMVRRHEILRTSFPSVDGRPVQVIHPPFPVKLPVVDLRGVPVKEAEADRLIGETLAVPFDVTRAPLVRWRMVRLEEEEWMLIQVEQHFLHDGWSYGVLLGELKALYSAFLRGEPSPLPELAIQFADFAHWQRGWMQGEPLQRHLEFWKRALAGNPTPTEIPTDRPRPKRATFRGDVQMFPFPAELYLELRQFSRRQGFTLYMTMLAGWFILLHRYSGQDDLLIATTIANRRTEEIEKLIGMIVNTILLRASVAGEPGVRDLLGSMRDLTLEAYAHQDMPFDRLVQELKPERQLGRNPLFQIMYNFHDAAIPDLEFGGMQAVKRFRGNRSAKVDVNVIFVPRGEQRIGMEAREEDRHAVLHWEYNTDLFDLETMQRMSRHYMTLLSGFLEDPNRPLSELPLLAETERRQVLEDWNDTATPEGTERIGTLLHDAFAARATLHPAREAVRFEGRSLTYGELNARADRLANVLRGLGVGPEVLVGLCVERSLDMMVGLLGVLKAGGAYVPLDPSYPADRLNFVVEDARIPVLVTQSVLRGCLDVPHTVAIDEIGSGSAGEPVRLAGPENLAYVIYTSGSTGRPKGVGIPHRAAVNFLTSMKQRPGLSEADTLVAVTTLSFDIALLELLLPLSVGGRVEIASRDTAADGMRLAALLASSGATAMQATPATWRVLLEAGWPGDPTLQALCGGEALPGDLAYLLEDRVGALWNVYGPTETTVWSTIHLVNGERPVPIGKPIANTTAFVLDRNFEPVPQGIPGELFLGGAGVARGYVGRPDLTAERFVPDRFGAGGGRVYRTGDVARFRNGGVLEFLGRADHQVKVRGFRIELGEIEAILGAQPSVGTAVVAARPDASGGSRLVAYVVPAKGESLSAADLRAALERKLPDYMVPSVFLELSELPLTPNGKVDRKALPEPEGRPEAEEYVEPRDVVERLLAEIWAEVLGIERVGVRDNFFSLGGHSLSAARVLSRVRNAFAVELPLSLVFERRTLEGMAAAIGAAAPVETVENAETDLLARAAVLSDSDLDALLRETLGNGGQS